MSSTTFKLPPKEEMLKRLIKVKDDPYARENFYPILTGHANEQQGGIGIVLMLQYAICLAYYGKHPQPLLGAEVNKLMPEFIDALCDDKGIATQAKGFFEKEAAAK